MRKIDSHLHFWNYEPVKDAWITDEMGALKQDFSPDQLLPLCMAEGIGAVVAVFVAPDWQNNVKKKRRPDSSLRSKKGKQ